jgi:Zn-dependent alcohol dehydrogenase
VSLLASCGNCYYCNIGLPHLCPAKFAPNPQVKLRNNKGQPLAPKGGVGINAIQGAAFSGAYPIIAVDVLDSKLKSAIAFGATHGVNANQDDAIDQVKRLTDGRIAGYVFVTVGNVGAIRQGFSMSGARGMTVIIGLPPMKE